MCGIQAQPPPNVIEEKHAAQFDLTPGNARNYFTRTYSGDNLLLSKSVVTRNTSLPRTSTFPNLLSVTSETKKILLKADSESNVKVTKLDTNTEMKLMG
jgi:hypothetical protein